MTGHLMGQGLTSPQVSAADDGATERAVTDDLARVAGLDAEQQLAAVDLEQLGGDGEGFPEGRRPSMADADLVADGGVIRGELRLRRVLGGQLHLEDHPDRHEHAVAAGVPRGHGRGDQGPPLAAQARHEAGKAGGRHSERARSRSSNFWILPVAVVGRGPKITVRGTAKRGRCSRAKPISSSAVSVVPGRSSTNAQGVSPHVSSGRATTAASATAGWRVSAASTARLAMFSPPEMMMSFKRSLISM